MRTKARWKNAAKGISLLDLNADLGEKRTFLMKAITGALAELPAFRFAPSKGCQLNESLVVAASCGQLHAASGAGKW